MSQGIRYQIFSPCGNDTALVRSVDFSQEYKKIINDQIMEIDTRVEQVGFIDTLGTPKLIMAGGEFCGNATRSAAYDYLQGQAGEITIEVSGAEGLLKAGVDEAGNAWSQMPIYSGEDVITALEPGIYKVKMRGIIHLIVEVEYAQPYLEDRTRIKESAMEIIQRNAIEDIEAVGVIFLEQIDQKLKIHPVVWVKAIDTLFYETACGSGTVALGILRCLSRKTSQNADQTSDQTSKYTLEVIQPSGQLISTRITLKKGKLANAIISGKVLTDGVLRKLEVEGVTLQQVGK